MDRIVFEICMPIECNRCRIQQFTLAQRCRLGNFEIRSIQASIRPFISFNPTLHCTSIPTKTKIDRGQEREKFDTHSECVVFFNVSYFAKILIIKSLIYLDIKDSMLWQDTCTSKYRTNNRARMISFYSTEN